MFRHGVQLVRVSFKGFDKDSGRVRVGAKISVETEVRFGTWICIGSGVLVRIGAELSVGSKMCKSCFRREFSVFALLPSSATVHSTAVQSL